MTVKQLKELLANYNDEDIVITNGIKFARISTPGGVYLEHTSGNGGCGTSKNGMFRGDCERCDHQDCAQCNWVEQK